MLPYTPPVDVVYPAMGVDENALEFNIRAIEEPVRYRDTSVKQPVNA